MVKMGRKKSPDPTETVRLPASLVRIANIIAAHEQKNTSDVLAELLDGPLKKRYAEVAKKMEDEVKHGRKQ